MTLSTSEVAVCCSRDSERSAVRCLNSLSSLAFSIAITACFAVAEQFDLLISERSNLPAVERDCSDQHGVLQHRDVYHRPCASDIG